MTIPWASDIQWLAVVERPQGSLEVQPIWALVLYRQFLRESQRFMLSNSFEMASTARGDGGVLRSAVAHLISRARWSISRAHITWHSSFTACATQQPMRTPTAQNHLGEMCEMRTMSILIHNLAFRYGSTPVPICTVGGNVLGFRPVTAHN